MSSLKRKNDAKLDSNKKPKVNASITSFFGAGPPSSPSSGPAARADASVKFDKAKWVAGLTPEQKRHLQLEIQTLDPTWLAHLKDEIVTPEFIELKKYLESEVKSGKKVFPPREDVYSWYVSNRSTIHIYSPTIYQFASLTPNLSSSIYISVTFISNITSLGPASPPSTR